MRDGRKTRVQLQADLTRLQTQSHFELKQSNHDLQVHQEELRAQMEELRETQSLLEQSRDQYAALYDFAPITYLTLDPFGVVKAINLTGCAILGLERSRVVGYPFPMFLVRENQPLFLDHMRRCRSGEAVRTEMTIQTRDGGLIPIELITSSSPGPDYRSAVMDLTDRKRAELLIRESHARLEDKVHQRTIDLEQANLQLRQEVQHRLQVERELQEAHKRKDEFLAMLGHELRNPLNPVRNAADVIKILVSDVPQVKEMCDVISRQTTHMARIVEDLLDVTRISSGKIVLHTDLLDICAVMRDLLADFDNEIQAQSLHLQESIPDEGIWVEADPTRLSQILGNILQNAMKFSERGGTITVSIDRDTAENLTVVRIRDTGSGIEPEMLSRLFEPFSQAERTLVRSRGGLGLGLAVAKGLLELHGGVINISSPGAGLGTEVTIRLPLGARPNGGDRVAKPITNSKPQRYRVLIIEDQPDQLRTMRILFEKLGHEVYTAKNGEEGIRLAHEKRPHVVISDIGLPGVDGYSVARSIRKDPAAKSALLVAVTGYGCGEDVRLAHEAGFDRHLTKPIAFGEIQGLLGDLVIV